MYGSAPVSVLGHNSFRNRHAHTAQNNGYGVLWHRCYTVEPVDSFL